MDKHRATSNRLFNQSPEGESEYVESRLLLLEGDMAVFVDSRIGKLKNLGKMDFDIPKSGTGSITTFRVRYIDEEPVEVPVYNLGKPFNVEYS